MNTAEDAISTLDSSMNTAEDAISTLDSSMNTVEDAISTLDSSITTAETNISLVDTSVNTLETFLDNKFQNLQDTSNSSFLTDVSNVIRGDGFAYLRAILNYSEMAVNTTGIVFGKDNTLGKDEISFITNGDTQLYINSSGDIGCGITSPTHKLDVDGNIHCTGTLFADSDINVKKDLEILKNPLDKILKINGYYYHKIDEDENAMKHIGVIAQEVEAEYPELVSNHSEIKSVNYDGINAILLESVKELTRENTKIKSELEELKDKLKNIEELISKK